MPHLTLTYKVGDNLYRGASYAAGVTTAAYDSLGRPTQTSAPNGEVTFYGYQGRASDSYTQDRTKTPNLADAYRLNQWQELDGLGYAANIRTWTHNGGINWTENARVIFTHDATGNLTSVTHPNGIGTTTMSYDLAGHKTAMNDVDLGNWRYAYDRQGKLTRQTDTLGQTTCLYYENVLERVSGKLFQTNTSCPPSVGAYNITYQYDQNQGSTNRSRGQLTYVTKTGWNKQILYQAQGLLAEELVNIQGAPQSYATYYGYDGYLRPNAIVYPDGEWATTTYNGMGLPATLSSNWYGTLVDSAAYDVAGRLTQMRFPLGNNRWRSHVYTDWTQNGSNGGRLSSIKVGTTAGQAGFLDEQYTYDSFGNIKTLFDNGNNYTFSYDAQNRLTNGYSQPYAYDSAGRLTNYEGYGLSAYAGHPHAMVNNASNYTFDANGNMKTQLGFQFFTWDAENHLSGMTSISGNESYLYDADGQRVKKTSNAGPVYYPNQFYEATVTAGVVAAAQAVDPCAAEPSPCPAATPPATTLVYLPWIQTVQQQPAQASAIGLPVPTKYYLFNGQRIAMRAYNVATNSSPITYLHSDHLGSVVLTSDGNANTASSFGGQRFRAYGQGFGVYGPPYAPVPTDYGFTGQKSDGTGLVYMNARYYDPQLGQFISPDSEVPDATNVFDYNRYMYARGNPMKYTDPTGHYSQEELMKHFGCDNAQCVSDHFGPNGDYAGLWGWFYILTQAHDGDSIYAHSIALAADGKTQLDDELRGTFATANGKIMIQMASTTNWNSNGGMNTTTFGPGALVSEKVGAVYGALGAFGEYRVDGKNSAYANPSVKHANCSYDDCVGLALDGLSDVASAVAVGCTLAGQGECAAPAIAVGKGLTMLSVGYASYQTFVTGGSTGTDLVVTLATSGVSYFGSPVPGLFAGETQTLYDYNSLQRRP